MSTQSAAPAYVSDFDAVYERELCEWVLPAARRREGDRARHVSDQPDLRNELVGLALSGGGIRSATFALGACQALARYGVLQQVDYLSTVSGGSYFGSAVSSLLHASQPPEPGHPLAPHNFPFRFGPSPGQGMRQFKAERAPVRHLREWSNYLAPRLGLFDTQTWYAVVRIVTLALVMLVLLALPPVVVGLTVLTALPREIWNRADPLTTPWVITGPLTLGLAALLVFAVLSILPWGSRPFHSTLQKVLLFLILGVVLWTGFVFTVQAAWAIPDWFKSAFGTGVVALVVASRWAYSRLGEVGRRLDTDLGSTSLGKWVRLALPSILFGLLGYLVLAMFVVLLYVVVDRVLPLWGRWLMAGIFGLVTLIVLTHRGLAAALNRLSLHSFYRDRLSASYIQREVDDEVVAGAEADVPLSDLQREGRAKQAVLGPFPIIGSALNIGGSTDVHRLGRKADAFFLSPLYCGSSITGFVPTEAYPHLTLGTAMAISGSAFSPNQGSATRTSLAILLTLLNARLGYWLTNPRAFDGRSGRQLTHSAPLALYWKEMFGQASSEDRTVYLSDGGHFDNSGIYELIRRRCRYIIAIDGSGEPSPELPRFGTLGLLTRLVRIDFGVDIQLDLSTLLPDASGKTAAYFAVGRVEYPRTREGETEEDRRGLLIYLKATLTKQQTSPDLEFYKRLNYIFPNHSTADQFFDEGQFESYRALGYQAAREVFRGPLEPPDGDLADDLDRELWARWNRDVMGRTRPDLAQAPVAGTER